MKDKCGEAIYTKEYAESKDASEKIKKIAAKLDENDNPVIVLVKLKK